MPRSPRIFLTGLTHFVYSFCVHKHTLAVQHDSEMEQPAILVLLDLGLLDIIDPKSPLRKKNHLLMDTFYF